MGLGRNLVKGLFRPANDVEAISAVKRPMAPDMSEPYYDEKASAPFRANDEHMLPPEAVPAFEKLPWKTPPGSDAQMNQAFEMFNQALANFDTSKLDGLSQTFFGRPWKQIKGSLYPFLSPVN